MLPQRCVHASMNYLTIRSCDSASVAADPGAWLDGSMARWVLFGGRQARRVICVTFDYAHYQDVPEVSEKM